MVQESGDSAACSGQQLVILFFRWVIQQQREKRRQEEALHRVCVGVKRTETRGLAPVLSWRKHGGWWLTLPQAKTKSGEEEWECKQTADTTQLQKHGKVCTFREVSRSDITRGVRERSELLPVSVLENKPIASHA